MSPSRYGTVLYVRSTEQVKQAEAYRSEENQTESRYSRPWPCPLLTRDENLEHLIGLATKSVSGLML